MLPAGLVILGRVELGLRAQLKTKFLFGAGLAKQKAPSILEGASEFQVDTWVSNESAGVFRCGSNLIIHGYNVRGEWT